jgi:lysophospholipase L1-like esterase
LPERIPQWVTAWSASLGGALGSTLPSDTTLRQFVRLNAGGSGLRLRLTNLADTAIVLTGVAVAAAAADGGALGPSVRVSRDGSARIPVPSGGSVVSDPVALEVGAFERLRISVTAEGIAPVSSHDFANTIAYVADGDRLDDGPAAFRPWRTSWAWVDAVEVRESGLPGTIVALGDSITDGAGSDFDSDSRWTDQLARRMLALPVSDPRRRAVANAGIGGNTVCSVGNAIVGANGLERLDRDVLKLAGVRELVVFHGTNDAFVGTPADEIVAALAEVASRARAAGIRPFVATLAPRVGGLDWDDERERRRAAVNEWIRRQDVYDAVLDFERVLTTPGEKRIRPDLDADHTHPGTRGYAALADSIDLGIFASHPTGKERP